VIARLALLLALAGSPARVVSMAPGLTDLVEALGEQKRLVGVSRFDDDPALSSLPRVGGLLDPSVEAVVRLKPDLVLAISGAAFASTLRALQAAGMNVLALKSDSLDDVRTSVEKLGAALRTPEAARAVWGRLQAQIDRVRAETAGKPVVKVAIAVGYRPLMLAGQGSYLQALIQVAGGANAAKSSLAWPTASFEALVDSPPDVLIDGAAPEVDDAAKRMLEILRGRGTRVVRLPDGELFRPGPRAIAALPELAKALHGTDVGPR
jgi:iron complex transport system substrate-binding protein